MPWSRSSEGHRLTDTPGTGTSVHTYAHRGNEQTGSNRLGSGGTAGVGTPFNRKGGDGR